MHGVVNIAFLALAHFGQLQMSCYIPREDTVLVTLDELDHEETGSPNLLPPKTANIQE